MPENGRIWEFSNNFLTLRLLKAKGKRKKQTGRTKIKEMPPEIFRGSGGILLFVGKRLPQNALKLSRAIKKTRENGAKP